MKRANDTDHNPIDDILVEAGVIDWPIFDHEGMRERGEHTALTRAEIEVFAIDPKLARALSAAMTRYEAMGGFVRGLPEDEMRQAAADRKVHGHLLRVEDGVAVFDPALAAKFMCEVCALPYDQCWAWVWKMEFAQWRDGLFVIDDAPVSDAYRRRMAEAEADAALAELMLKTVDYSE